MLRRAGDVERRRAEAADLRIGALERVYGRADSVTVRYAASLSGAADIVPSKNALPLRSIGSLTDTMPGVAWNACCTVEACAAFEMTTTGALLPAGKCFASTVSPTTESGWPRNASLFVRPLALRSTEPMASTTSAAAVPTQTMRGRPAIRRPVRAHMPLAVGSADPYDGRFGQNTQRPQITSNAGRSESIAARAKPTPIASTGPRPFVEFISAK